MSRGPRRLKDDPDFQWETGCNLGEESVLAQGYDLAAMREAVLARAPVVGDGVPTVRPRASWRWWIGGLVGVSTTLTAFWLGTQYTGLENANPPMEQPTIAPPVPRVAPMDAPVAGPPPLSLSPEGDAARDAPASPTLDEPPAAPPIERRPDVARPAAEVASATPAPVSADPDDGAAVVPTNLERSSSALGDEFAVYDPAQEALQAGDASKAAAGFRAYLERFPEGKLKPDAELGLLWALRDLGDAARTERWAAMLLEQPAHTGSHDAIRELRAQALVRLGRCDEALESLTDAPGRIVGPIRRACRRR